MKTRVNTDLPFAIDEELHQQMDAADNHVKRIAYGKSDLTIASTEKIAEEWESDSGEIKYKEIQLSYNAAGQVIKYEIIGYTNTPPSWASTLLS